MPIDIQNKRSDVNSKAPAAGVLQPGEIGVNYHTASPAIYIEDDAGAVIKIAGAGSISGAWTQVGSTTYPTSTGDDILIGGTLPASPNIKLEASGAASLTGDVAIGGILPASPNITLTATSGNAAFTGKVTAASTVSTDAGATVVTKDYLEGAGSGTGSLGYWSRTGTTVTPVNAGDDFSTTGNILIGGTLPVSPAITLSAANGSAAFTGKPTAALTLAADAAAILTTKSYVDALSLTSLSDVTLTAEAENSILALNSAGQWVNTLDVDGGEDYGA